MEVIDQLIEKLKNWEENDKETFFPIRRLAEAEKMRQLKQGERIKVRPIIYQCPYCTHQEQQPEPFYLHLTNAHMEKGDPAREQIFLQEKEYSEDMTALENLTQKYTEVMLDVDYTDETRNT